MSDRWAGRSPSEHRKGEGRLTDHSWWTCGDQISAWSDLKGNLGSYAGKKQKPLDLGLIQQQDVSDALKIKGSEQRMGGGKEVHPLLATSCIEPPKPHIVYLEMSDVGEEQLEGLLGDFTRGHLMGLLGY